MLNWDVAELTAVACAVPAAWRAAWATCVQKDLEEVVLRNGDFCYYVKPDSAAKNALAGVVTVPDAVEVTRAGMTT